MLIKELGTASETRQRVHGITYSYDLEKYPFRQELENLFGLDLQDLHLWLGNFEKFDRKNDQQTIVHRVFYSNYTKIIEPIYKDFVTNFEVSGVMHSNTIENAPAFSIFFASSKSF